MIDHIFSIGLKPVEAIQYAIKFSIFKIFFGKVGNSLAEWEEELSDINVFFSLKLLTENTITIKIVKR